VGDHVNTSRFPERNFWSQVFSWVGSFVPIWRTCSGYWGPH